MTLIDRLSKLDGPDREVDALIECEAGDEVFWGHRLGKNKGTVVAYFDRPNGDIGHSTYKAPRYTASVDAAIALAERVLPGKGIDLLREAISELGKKYDWHICLKKPEQAKELPIQVCIALLRAKEASKL